MARLLVCQHVPFEILGTFHALLKALKFRIRYVNFGRHPDTVPSVAGYDGLIILGGPISAYHDELYPHIRTEIKLVQDALAKDIPVLGICLGSQIIARALGAKVQKNPHPEIGWYEIAPTAEGLEDKLIQHFKGPRQIFQWHGDSFDLPDGCVHLASSELCRHQAFRYGDKVWGFQFHLEVDKALIERWLTVPLHVEELESLKGVIDPNTIREHTNQHLAEAMTLSNQVFSSFVSLFNHKKASLPTR